jgi:hypothetical protein
MSDTESDHPNIPTIDLRPDRKQIDLAEMKALTGEVPDQDGPGDEFIRKMRDDARY